MFTTNLDTFKIQEKELHRQAVQYRLGEIFRTAQSNFRQDLRDSWAGC